MMRWLLPVGVLALIALGVIWFLSAFERVPAKEWVGPTGEARRNPFLAAERLAGRMGLGARELRALPELDTLKPTGALLIPNHRQAIDARRLRQLATWVERGGHLIAEAELVGVADPLLDALGVERAAGPPPTKPAPVELPGGRKVAVSIFGGMALKAPGRQPRLLLGTAEGARLVSFPHGKGMVTATISLQFARNQTIGTSDNAEFFWHVLQLAPAAELAIYMRPERLSLWGFLTDHAAPVLASTAALLALWLWRIGPRFGPVHPDAPPARRRLLDHLRATGRYYWSKDLRVRLLGAARDAALRRVGRAQPDFAASPDGERAARLSALAGISREDALRFMTAGADVRGTDFIRIMHTAQRIHSALEKGNR